MRDSVDALVHPVNTSAGDLKALNSVVCMCLCDPPPAATVGPVPFTKRARMVARRDDQRVTSGAPPIAVLAVWPAQTIPGPLATLVTNPEPTVQHMHKPARPVAAASVPRVDSPAWVPRPAVRTPTRPARENDRWEATAAEWVGTERHGLWRRISDQIYVQALQPLLSGGQPGLTLKTDLFDEAVSGGIAQELVHAGAVVVGIDLSRTIVRQASAQHPSLLAVVADTRVLPFKAGAFDTAVSFSTLDHFEIKSDIAVALGELGRVVREGGAALVTLDNARNPVIAFRNFLPPKLRRLVGVPYWVGPTLGPSGLRRTVECAGFRIEQSRALVHVPRAIVVALAQVIDRLASSRAARALAGLCHRFERLDQLPTRYLTGCFALVIGRRIAKD